MTSIVTYACRLPDGIKVRKPTGTAPRTLVKKLKLYGDGGSKEVIQEVKAAYLISENGSITVIDSHTMLAVDFDGLTEAYEFLRDLEEEVI